MTQITDLNLEFYKDLALRRKWWIICPLVLSIMGSIVYLKVTPKIYRANTLILVQPQKVPASYVDPTVTESVESRLRTISQQVYSRTNLEKIIEQFDLYAKDGEKKPMMEIVKGVRKRIVLNRRGKGTSQSFEISFEWHDPKITADVTNAIASQFIEKNLKVREAMAMGTTKFLENEVTKIKERLEKQEKAVEQFKKKHMGMLPDQLQVNINILGQLKEQLSNVEMSARNEQEKTLFLQRQMELLEAAKQNNSEIGNSLQPIVAFSRLNSLKEQLEELRSRYTEKHPDVIALKRGISAQETELRAKQNLKNDDTSSSGVAEETHLPLPERLSDLARQREELKITLERANKNIGKYKAEAEKIKNQLSLYNERIERIPEINLELTKLTRDYAIIRKRYELLLNKKINAQLAEQLERRQKGEQFKVVDPAIIPEKPVKPDVKKVMLMALMAGLGIGCGLAYLREIMGGSFYSTEDLEGFLGARVLVSIPFVKGNI